MEEREIQFRKLFEDEAFNAELKAVVEETIRGNVGPNVKANPFMWLCKNGFLNGNILKEEYLKILNKESALSSNNRRAIQIIMDFTLIKYSAYKRKEAEDDVVGTRPEHESD